MVKKIRIETSDGTIVHVYGKHVSINGEPYSDSSFDSVRIERYAKEAVVRLAFVGKIMED